MATGELIVKVSSIVKMIKEYGAWEVAEAAGVQEVAKRDRMIGWKDYREANRCISRVRAGFAAPEFWAASTADEDVLAAFGLADVLRAQYGVKEAA